MKYQYYECGKGWESLILQAESIVDKYNIEHPDEEPLEFTQIKEKWGGLCLYLNKYIPEIQIKMRELMERSWAICENCGTDKNVTREYTHGWVMTLCDKCREEEINKYNQKFK